MNKIRRFMFLLALPAAGTAAEFQELNWLHPGADSFRHLSFAAVECLDVSREAEAAFRVELGRQLFRTPAVLGGGAVNEGLSCDTCHASGRANPDFYFDGISGEAGTADISNDLVHKLPPDNSLDPIPIPSLVDTGDKESFGAQSPVDSLSGYIRPMLAEALREPEASAAASALAAYVGALSSSACPEQQQDQVAYSVGQQMYEISRAFDVLKDAVRREEAAVMGLAAAAAGHQIGLLHRRYDIETTAGLAGRIMERRRALETIAEALGSTGEEESLDRLDAWWETWQDLRPALLHRSAETLYLRSRLEQWMRNQP